VGTWQFRTRLWLAPGALPTESTGKAEIKTILGGQYVLDRTEGTFNKLPFRGMGITGYDNLKKEYVSTWIDNVGTGLMSAEGVYDDTTKSLQFAAQAPDVTRGTYKPVRWVERMVDADTWVTEIYDRTPQGKEFKHRESTYRRVKDNGPAR
jgi:hypothetical protein